MPRSNFLLVGLMLASATITISLPVLADPPVRSILPPAPISPTQAKPTVLARDFGRLPLSFESNRGQADAKVRFLNHSGDSALFLTPTEAVFTLPTKTLKGPAEKGSLPTGQKVHRGREKWTATALRMQMVGSDPKASALEQQALPGRINYMIGNNPHKWHTGVPTFGRVGFHGVYPGVDLVYYGNRRNLEYDFLVAPHADPKQIHLHFAGAQSVQVNAAGDLLVKTQGREWRWQRPAVYQQDAKGKHSIASRFRLQRLTTGQTGVSFALGRYDTDRALVIDPVLVYSTYLGGSDLNYSKSIAVDSQGNAYITGETTSADFPIAGVPFQQTLQGSKTAFVTKLNAAGTALIYSTYMGGNGSSSASGIAVDSQGSAYIAGVTDSTSFPVTPGAFQATTPAVSGNTSAFVTKLNPTGSALIYSTYIGPDGSTGASGIAVDSQGSAYITGDTLSPDFPITAGAFQTTLAFLTNPIGGSSAFVTKLNPAGTALIYSTFLGGNIYDHSYSIAVDSQGCAYVTGEAQSPDFPTTPGAFQTTNHARLGGINAFVTKFNPTGTGLIYSTYLGGSDGRGNAIALDSQGNAYIAGQVGARDFPVTPGAFQTILKGGFNAFVTKLNSAGTALLYSTYLGGSDGDRAVGIAVDSHGNAYITGETSSRDFPVTPGAFQSTSHANLVYSNAFVTKLNPTGTALLYSTFLGGSDYASGAAIAVDSQGNAYITGDTSSTDFPVTKGAFQTAQQGIQRGTNNAFVTKLHAVPILPDFNNDGFTDLLIQNASTHQIASWFMQGAKWVGGAYFSLTPPIEYTLVGSGDFRSNGLTTLVLQSRNSNQIAFWYANGTNLATISGGDYVDVTPPVGWKAVGVADFNGDGKSDLLFQNQTTNRIAIWFMNGPVYQGGVLLPITPPAEWSVVGAGDINGDGFSDIVFQNQSTGQIAVWFMNGPTFAGGVFVSAVPDSGWKVVGVGDYNGDGYADLLFQNQTTNQAALWYLQNGIFTGGNRLSLTPPTGWKIVGPR
jgi:hypothetical protein